MEPWIDERGNERARLALRPNGYDPSVPESERRTYRGGDFWKEDVWRSIEAAFGAESPAESLREEIRHSVFNYVAHACPFYFTRLEWDAAAGLHRRIPGRARAHSEARDIPAALEAIENAARKLWALVEPLPRTDEKRNIIRAHTLDKLAWGAMEWRQPEGRPGQLECVGGYEYVNGLLNALRRLPDVARHGCVMFAPRPKPGRSGEDKNNLVVLVWRMANLFEACLGVPATKPAWWHRADAYTGKFHELLDLIARHLPRLPGTLGAMSETARGKATQRALDEIVRRAQLSGSAGGDGIMAPLTIRRALRIGQNRRRRG